MLFFLFFFFFFFNGFFHMCGYFCSWVHCFIAELLILLPCNNESYLLQIPIRGLVISVLTIIMSKIH